LNQNEDSKTLSDRKNTRIFSEAVLQIGRNRQALSNKYKLYYEKLKTFFRVGIATIVSK
jgi:hypothetical protein